MLHDDFLTRLPNDVGQQVQPQADKLDLTALGRLADQMWFSRNRKRADVLVALPLPPAPDSALVEENLAAVAALSWAAVEAAEAEGAVTDGEALRAEARRQE